MLTKMMTAKQQMRMKMTLELKTLSMNIRKEDEEDNLPV
jgi:hypothetical protein